MWAAWRVPTPCSPLSAPGFRGAKSCCTRALWLSRLHPDSNPRSLAQQVRRGTLPMSPHFLMSEAWPGSQGTAHPVAPSSSQSRTWVGLPSSLISPRGLSPQAVHTILHLAFLELILFLYLWVSPENFP